jgi:membrane fusion protein (multidrug efflux system)
MQRTWKRGAEGGAAQLGAALGAVACLLAVGIGIATPTLAASELPGVIVSEVQRLPFPLTIESLGTAHANESVELRPLASQRIVKILFEEGEQVEAGRVLVELQSAEARADVASAKATLSDSVSQLRRAQQLFETKAVSASELDRRVTRRDADQAALDAAHARFADTRVSAPFAGVLGLRRVSLGSYVTPETVITTLDDTQTIKLDFSVPETVLARIAPGLPVRARSAAWPGSVFEGVVASVDTRVDVISRTLKVRARVPNEDGRLRPGMFLTVDLLRDDVTALVVPEGALVPEHNRQFVLVVGEGDEVERREVETGRRRPGLVEVRSGLSAGEVVVVEGTQKAIPGRTVRVIERRSLSSPPLALDSEP